MSLMVSRDELSQSGTTWQHYSLVATLVLVREVASEVSKVMV